jgi:chromosome segregation ATPase
MKYLKDRIFSYQNMDHLPLSISIDDELREQIELLNFKVKDTEESLESLDKMNASLNLRNAELSTYLEQEQQYRLKQSDNSYQLNQAEARIIKLEKDLATEIGNRNVFRQFVAEQDKFIKGLKESAFKAEAEHKRILEARKNEVDHLAHQCVRIDEENSQLRTDNCKFKEQTTRLIEENRKLEDEKKHYLEQNQSYECWGCKTGEQGAYCGGCLGCISRQTEHSMHELDKTLKERNAELARERKIRMIQRRLIIYITTSIDLFRKLPFWSIRKKNRIIEGVQNEIQSRSFEIETVENFPTP